MKKWILIAAMLTASAAQAHSLITKEDLMFCNDQYNFIWLTHTNERQTAFVNDCAEKFQHAKEDRFDVYE